MFKKTLSHSLHSDTAFEHIQARLQQDYKLKKRVQALLPDDLASRCDYCTIRQNTLILFTQSSVWASRLFYHRNAILDGLNRKGCDPIRSVKTCVQSTPKPLPHQPFKRAANPDIAKLIEQSGQIQSDTDLKLSLLNLAEAIKRQSKKF